jgi:hypothetical protein
MMGKYRAERRRRQLMIYPFMDAFFVMLVFMLSIAILKKALYCPEGETGTPFNAQGQSVINPLVKAASEAPTGCSFVAPGFGTGETNLLIRLNSDGSCYWFDYSQLSGLREAGDDIDTIVRECAFPRDDLGRRWSSFLDRLVAINCTKLSVAIQASADISIGDLVNIQNKLLTYTARDRIRGIHIEYALLPIKHGDEVLKEIKNSDTALLLVL